MRIVIASPRSKPSSPSRKRKRKKSITSLVTVGAAATAVSKATPAAAPTAAPAARAATTSAAGQQPPTKGMVWVNLDTKVFHREGDQFYGKTKNGKFMTEADAVKAGYREAKTGASKSK